MREPVIIEAVRTPIGKRNGWLAGLHPAELLAASLNEVIRRAAIEPSLVNGGAIALGHPVGALATGSILQRV